jgi:hypothetical protein
MSDDITSRVALALRQADQEFADSGDVMGALRWVAFAAQAGAPMPPRIATWLRQAVLTYVDGAGSMDHAMGLAQRGKAQPRQKGRAALALNDMLGRMWFLIAAGATRTHAAEMVAVVTSREPEQLARSGQRGPRVGAARGGISPHLPSSKQWGGTGQVPPLCVSGGLG